MACSNSIEKKELAEPMRVGLEYAESEHFIQSNKGYPCRMTCAICKGAWLRTGTKQVHILFVKKKQLFICDACTGIKELKNVEVRKFK